MEASARIVAEVDGRGGTRLVTLRGESPLLLRRTGPRTTDGVVTVHLVGGAAGPLRGDELRLDIEVGPGARLDVRSVAASIALPGRAAAPPSRLTITATVGSGAMLRWLPEPLIAAAGCHHLTRTDVQVAAGGTLVWRDDLVCGRHGEPSGDVRTDTTIRYANKTLYRHELSVGPSAPGWSEAAVLGTPSRPQAAVLDVTGRSQAAGLGTPGRLQAAALGTLGRSQAAGLGTPGRSQAAGLGTSATSGAATTSSRPPTAASSSGGALGGGGRAVGSVIFAGTDLPPAGLLGPNAVIMPLAGPGMLASAVGTDIREVRAALDPLITQAIRAPQPNTEALAAATSPA